jgi:aminobenzoyl-glutamate utilization protein B
MIQFLPSPGKHCRLALYLLGILAGLVLAPRAATAQAAMPPAKLEALKQELIGEIDKQQKATQQMVDMVFSFGELGFQETETSRYLTGILKKNGFVIQTGIAGVPTAWTATWGSGKPVIAIGSDIDCIPKASQKPGVAYHDPIIEGAPGHGEGHNSGIPLNITAVLALKKIMEREKLPGTLMLWPGAAEELLGTKAYYVRAGYFKNVDACIFTHVGDNLSVSWGDSGYTGAVSVKFLFEGQAAHAGVNPWRGRSALDAVELMDVGWNFHREHMDVNQRSHYVITDGGDQPNVVPSKAAVWYFLRERTDPKIREMYADALKMAEGATLMTKTTVTHEVLGSAWPIHLNKAIAQAMYQNIRRVGLPQWSAADQVLARAAQAETKAPKMDGLNRPIDGLATRLDTLKGPTTTTFGGSDDIGDISWSVPTVVLRYPANIPGLPGHHWANAIAMATPIAHKGVTAGAKAEALTLLDLLVKPELLKEAWAYFNDVQTKDTKYTPLISATDKPAITLNQGIMAQYRPQMTKFYYNPAKYKTYLEQLGIAYPTVRPAPKAGTLE